MDTQFKKEINFEKPNLELFQDGFKVQCKKKDLKIVMCALCGDKQ